MQCAEHRAPDDVRDAARREYQDRERAREREEALRNLGVPRVYWTAIEDAVPSTALDAVQTFIRERHRRCLVLCGNPGLGKTFAAAWGLLSLPQRRWPMYGFWQFGDWAQALHSQDHEEQDLAKDAVAKLLLVLDDLGVGHIKPSGWVATWLDQLFVTREAEQLATIVTTNLTPRQLASYAGPRIADRLAGAWADVVVVKGQSRRRRP